MIWNEISLSHDSSDVLGAFWFCLQTHFIICSVHTRFFPKNEHLIKQKQKRHIQFEKQQQQQHQQPQRPPQQTVVIYLKMKCIDEATVVDERKQ